MDAYGHINNTAYLAYLEQARVSMFFDRYDSTFAGGTVVNHHEITYLRPVVYHPEPLRLELWVDRIRAASFRVLYDVFDGEAHVASASTTLVTFNFDTDRPRRLTSDERAILAGFADDGLFTTAADVLAPAQAAPAQGGPPRTAEVGPSSRARPPAQPTSGQATRAHE